MLALVCTVIFGWSGAWLYLRSVFKGQIETELVAMNSGGNKFECGELAIAGFPFRFEVNCADLQTIDQTGTTASLGELRAVALVYNPRHVIFEASGPARIIESASGGDFTADWSVAQSSVLFSDTGVRQIDVSIQDVVVSLLEGTASGELSVENSEIHLRPDPGAPDILEAFLSLETLSSNLASDFPAPINAKLHVRLPGGMDLLEGKPFHAMQREATGPLPLDLVLLSLSSGGVRLTASGKLRLMPSGALSGEVDVQVARLENAIEMLAALFPEGSTLPATIQGAATAFGVPGLDEQGGQQLSLPLTLDEGAIRIGVIPLGTIPPVLAGDT